MSLGGKHLKGNYLLAIDVGTTACKSAVFTDTGNMLVTSYREYTLYTPSPEIAEQDASKWLSLIDETVIDCLSKIESRERICAVGLSVQGITILPVDENNQPLMNAITWLDSRAGVQAAELEAQFGYDRLFATSGVPANGVYMLPKLMWLKQHKPEVFHAASHFCTCQDFITVYLMGEYWTDHSVAGASLMYDIQAEDWWDEALAFAGISREKLPKIEWAGKKLGVLRKEIAGKWGVPETVSVVLGAHDQECAAAGAGLGMKNLTISLGTAAILVRRTSSPVIDKKQRIPMLAFVSEKDWVLEAAISIGCAGLRWVRDLFNGAGASLDFSDLDKLANEASAIDSDLLFFPHMTGATAPYWSAGTGAMYGMSLSTTAGHMIRSIAEGYAYQIRHNIEVMSELSGELEALVVFGGGTKSTFQCGMIADLTGLTVQVPKVTECALLGAAMLAGIGAGIYKDIEEGQKRMVQIDYHIETDKENHKQYTKKYKRYLELEKLLLTHEEEYQNERT